MGVAGAVGLRVVLVLSMGAGVATAAPVSRLAIRDVAVLDLTTGRWAEAQTVVVAGDRIQAIVPSSEFEADAATTWVEGRGRFLIPGLIDSHVHLFSPDDLVAYLTHGVTTVVNMSGTPSDLALRERVRRGELVGPRIYTAGPTIDGNPPLNELFATAETPAQARTLVASHKRAGYDFIKVYGTLRPDTFRAVADECRRARLALTGHLNRQMDTREVLASGQVLAAHAEDLLFARFGEPPARSALEEFAREVARSGMTVTANVAIAPNVERQILDLETLLASGDGQDLSAAAYSQWIRVNNRNLDQDAAAHVAELRQIQAVVLDFVRLLHEDGVPLVLGSDAAAYGFPGASAWAELAESRKAGLSALDALRTATSNAGAYIARAVDPQVRLGTIEPGARADLVLLEADPLGDDASPSSIAGVVAAGRWLSRERLATLRDETRARLREEHRRVEELDARLAAGDVAFVRKRIEAGRGGPPLFAEWVLNLKARRLGDRPRAALELAELDVAMYPRSFSAHRLLAELLFAAGRSRDAAREARASLRLQPGNAATVDLSERIRYAAQKASFARGRYDLAVVARDETPSPVILRLDRGPSGWTGAWVEGGEMKPLEVLAAGGDRLWLNVGRDGNARTIRLVVAKDGTVSGDWSAAFGRNGRVQGAAARRLALR